MPLGFQRRSYFQPDNIDTGRGAVLAAQSGLLQSFANRAQQTATGLTLREAVRAGGRAGIQGVPTLRSEWTEAARVYNDAAMRSYMARATHEIETTLDRLELESAHDLDRYDALTQGASQGHIANAPEWARPDLDQYYRRRIAEGRVRVEHLARVREREEDGVAVRSALGPLAKRAAAAGAMPLADAQEEAEFAKTHGLALIAGAVSDGTFSPAVGFELAQSFAQSIDEGAHGARLDLVVNEAEAHFRADIESGDEYMATLDRREDLTDSDRAVIRSKVNTRLNVLHDERRRVYADGLTEVEAALATDRADRRTARLVEDLYTSGALTPGQAADYHGQIEGNIRKRAEEDAITRALSEAIASGLPLDPDDKDHRKALALAFDRDSKDMPTGSEQWQQLAIHYGAKTRMLPSQATAWVRQGIRSPDPNVAAAAAQFYGAVQSAVPDAADGFDQDTRAFAGMVNSMLEVGTDPERAVESARALSYDIKPDLRERRTREFRQLAKQTDAVLLELVDRDFDPGLFASAPAAGAGLKADFAGQAERYYAKTGDFALAASLAWQDLKRVYGPSTINGTAMLMAFPPEQYGVTPAEVRVEIGNFLKGNPQAGGATAADVLVIPDSLTMRRVHDAMDGSPVRPSYRLITTSGDLVVDRNGVPKRYTIPTVEELTQRFQEAQEQARVAAEAEVASARNERVERVRRRQQQRALADAMRGKPQ